MKQEKLIKPNKKIIILIIIITSIIGLIFIIPELYFDFEFYINSINKVSLTSEEIVEFESFYQIKLPAEAKIQRAIQNRWHEGSTIIRISGVKDEQAFVDNCILYPITDKRENDDVKTYTDSGTVMIEREVNTYKSGGTHPTTCYIYKDSNNKITIEIWKENTDEKNIWNIFN